jgi:hypothetical protein
VGDEQEYTPPVGEDFLYLSQGRAERAAQAWPPDMQKRRAPRAPVPHAVHRLSVAGWAPSGTVTAPGRTPSDRPDERRAAESSAGTRRCKRGHPSGALILKPCKFAVKPVSDRRTTADCKAAWHMYTRSRA